MRTQIDPRGVRFAAAVTTVVLAGAILTGSGWLLAAQTAIFAAGAIAGPAASPYGRVFARLIRPRLGAPRHLEDAAPPRFAQAVGAVFGLVALLGLLAGVGGIFYVALAGALAAAFLNAAFGFCLGCEIYLAYRRLVPSRHSPSITEVAS